MSQQIATKLKVARINKNLKQEQVAAQLGISKKTLSHYETGRVPPSVEMLKKFVKFYNLSADYFLDTENERTIRTDGLKDFQIEYLEHSAEILRKSNNE